MITTEEWKRRNRYCDDKKIPEPCLCCPDELCCEPEPEELIFPADIMINQYLTKIPATHMFGAHSPVGYWQCLRLNRWILGLSWREVKE